MKEAESCRGKRGRKTESRGGERERKDEGRRTKRRRERFKVKRRNSLEEVEKPRWKKIVVDLSRVRSGDIREIRNIPISPSSDKLSARKVGRGELEWLVTVLRLAALLVQQLALISRCNDVPPLSRSPPRSVGRPMISHRRRRYENYPCFSICTRNILLESSPLFCSQSVAPYPYVSGVYQDNRI